MSGVKIKNPKEKVSRNGAVFLLSLEGQAAFPALASSQPFRNPPQFVDFIQKTRCLDYEWGLLFDYVTGEILKCVKGKEDKVRLDSAGDEFEGKHLSSIHNHPDYVLSPPSYKNFNIFLRIHEDY